MQDFSGFPTTAQHVAGKPSPGQSDGAVPEHVAVSKKQRGAQVNLDFEVTREKRRLLFYNGSFKEQVQTQKYSSMVLQNPETIVS